MAAIFRDVPKKLAIEWSVKPDERFGSTLRHIDACIRQNWIGGAAKEIAIGDRLKRRHVLCHRLINIARGVLACVLRTGRKICSMKYSKRVI